jgi:hypothetical protein
LLGSLDEVGELLDDDLARSAASTSFDALIHAIGHHDSEPEEAGEARLWNGISAIEVVSVDGVLAGVVVPSTWPS